MVDQDSYKQHISEQFNAELEGVKTRMLEMGGMVEQQVSAAVDALVAMDRDEAENIVSRDVDINAMEVAIDDECYSSFFVNTPLLTVEDLIFANLRSSGFVLYLGRFILYVDIREGMCTALIAHEQGVAL